MARVGTRQQPSWSRERALSFALLMYSCYAKAQIPALQGNAGVSRAGGAGHALLFRDHVLLKTDFKDFPTTAMTFEAWISSTDFCHAGTILSYAKNSQATDESQRVQDFNHFVIFDPRNLLACHDFEFIDLLPDPTNSSCHASFRQSRGSSNTATAVERDGSWHHLAVTWDANAKGLTNIYMDGLLMASAVTDKTAPLEPGGAFMIGGEQDCFGGCTDPSQGFHGQLDEVRVWRVARTQADILKTMRWVTGLEGNADLVAWWRFNEPDNDEGMFRNHVQALDSSGKGNHMMLINPPSPRPATINMPAFASAPPLATGGLEFRNNYAMSKFVKNMPSGSFTVEFWAKGASIGDDDDTQARSSNLISYATQKVAEGGAPTGFMDDALRIERVLHDLSPPWLEPFFATSTAGSVVLHINSNEHTDAEDTRAWMYFDSKWTDDKWHHIAASWDATSGTASLLFDGSPVTPFWKSDWGVREMTASTIGGVDPTLSPNSKRGSEGALVLGQDQDCFGGCFSPSDAFFGQLAVVRIWRRVLTTEEIRKGLSKTRPENTNDLAALYVFDGPGIKPAEGGGDLVIDRSGGGNHLALRSNSPLYVYSMAPLAFTDGRPVGPPTPGAGGYSLALNDKQVLLLTNFKDFPSTELTLEFWMWSVDTCRPGVPFSYAAGQYERQDNAFLLFNYNSWGLSVMEDEGTLGDHLSGVSATDGNWHHVAVTWQSSTGRVVLYDNGRPMWTVNRGRGRTIPSGGTLVIGREQDCMGGCFDSAAGAAGRTSTVKDQEYGPQDFFGVIEEMRLWKRVRTPEEIRQSMAADDGRGPGGFKSPGVDPGHPDLVLYYKFDEGQGYVVKDVTGHGHDLSITQPPKWQVTRWLSTCGNAVVEGLEECDDGDLTDGDGCSASCTIENGYMCSGSPSICFKKSPIPPPPSPPAQPDGPPPSQPSGGDATPRGPQPSKDGGTSPDTGGNIPASGGGHKRSKARIAAIVVLSVLASMASLALVALAYVHRVKLSRAAPQLRDTIVSWVPGADRIVRARQGYVRGLNYDPLIEDHASYGAPDFMAMSPAPAPSQRAHAPGGPGPYQPLVGSPPPHGHSPASNGVV